MAGRGREARGSTESRSRQTNPISRRLSPEAENRRMSNEPNFTGSPPGGGRPRNVKQTQFCGALPAGSEEPQNVKQTQFHGASGLQGTAPRMSNKANFALFGAKTRVAVKNKPNLRTTPRAKQSQFPGPSRRGRRPDDAKQSQFAGFGKRAAGPGDAVVRELERAGWGLAIRGRTRVNSSQKERRRTCLQEDSQSR